MKIYAAAVAKTPSPPRCRVRKGDGQQGHVVFDTAGAAAQSFRPIPSHVADHDRPLIRNAESTGALRDGTSTIMGSTFAGVAVPPGSKKPDVSSPEKLKAALLAAKRIAVSDPARGATVGTHFMKVIERWA